MITMITIYYNDNNYNNKPQFVSYIGLYSKNSVWYLWFIYNYNITINNNSVWYANHSISMGL